MYELIQVSPRDYYIASPAKIGLVALGGGDVCLIDSGNDKDAGRKVRQVLDGNGFHLRAIYCTHSHADHIGGCKYLQSQTGCAVYAPGMDCAFTRHPLLESAFLYGGYPSKALRHKFLMAQESDAAYLTAEALPEGFELIALPGHCFDMVGFRTPDDTVFLADCLSSRETLDKYGIGYLYDVAACLETLERVKTMTARLFIPAHAAPTDTIAPLAQYNIDCILAVGARIEELCQAPMTTETILQRLFDEYHMTMTFEQHALIGSTLRSYLSWLKDSGRIEAVFEDNMLLWKTL